jgi:uncharacterized membrane protein YphA (DoxX/SURF4 family)
LKIDFLGNRWLTLFFRLGLGATFVIFGSSKLADLSGFVKTVIDYNVLPESLARVYGNGLPYAEVIVGSFLILGLGLKFVAPVGILIVASLIAGTSGNLYWSETTVKTCGCLPGLEWQLGIGHLVAQVVMLTAATQIWLHKGEMFSLDAKLFHK